ncbi:MAG: NAD(P)/FAD-dependent oxidoreductase [Candidatus Pacearchaeota archaeon]|jgi:flavin-dependent dehydrogenase
MTKKEYDVIIVGAGISGLRLAEKFNKSKLKVLLIEKKVQIKKLKIGYYGTFHEYVDKLGIRKYAINKSGFGIYSTEYKFYEELKGHKACVIDLAPWAASRKLNCEIRTGADIISLKRENQGITLEDNHKNKYYAKIVVDCSGYAQVISTLLGIKKSSCDFLDHVFLLEKPGLKVNQFLYFQDSDLTNIGGWFHPLGKGRYLIGCSELTSKHSLTKKELRKRLVRYIDNFDPLSKYLKGAKIIEEFSDTGPTTVIHSSIIGDNYIGVGDAAGAGTPFIGDCVRVAMVMADNAYESILQAFKKNDFSRKAFKNYEDKFNEEFGKWYKWSYLFRFIFRRYLSNREFNLMCKRLENFSHDDFYDVLLSRISPRLIWKLFNFKIAFFTFLNIINYHILSPIGITKSKYRPLILK